MDEHQDKAPLRASMIAMLLVAIGCIGIALTYPHITATGQYLEPSSSSSIRPPIKIDIPTTPPSHPFTQPVVVPTDVTAPNIPNFVTGGFPDVLSGLSSIRSFPGSEVLKGSTDFILVRATEGSVFQKISPYMVNLTSGQLLLAVHKPSNTGMVQTPLGRVALFANSDVLVSFVNGVLRIENIDGLGENVKVNLDQGPFAGAADPMFAMAPGFELIASDRKLDRTDLRPRDGIARRKAKLIHNGYIAISEFSVESVLQSSSLVAEMNRKESGSKDRRVVADMSRMAAVLNNVNGGGYEASAK